MYLYCLLLAVVSFGLSASLCWWLIRWGTARGRMDRPSEQAHKGHRRAVVNIGGVAIFAAVAAPIGAAMVAGWVIDASKLSGWLAAAGEHLPGLRKQTPLAIALLVSLAALHVTGLIDDRRNLRPRTKLMVQAAAALLLAAGFEVRIFQFVEALGAGGIAISIALTVLWIVAVTNAMNMLDNMDGLAGGVGAIIAGVYLAATLIGGQWFVAAVCALLLGALVGFGLFNLPPARLFMGDGGSLVVGFLLAVISVRTTYFDPQAAQAPAASWYATLMPLIILTVPLYDLCSVCLIRLRQGRSLFVGDRQHFSHRLVERGLSEPAAVMVICLATMATGIGGVMFNSLQPWQAVLVALQTAAVIALIGVLEWTGRRPAA